MKAAVYCRVSTAEQAQNETIENQTGFARTYCDLHHIPIHDFYKDDGVSATIAFEKRPEGSRLLRDAQEGRFDIVLVYRLDRFARNTLHLLTAHERLDGLGIGLRSMTETFDTSTPTGKFFMTMLGSIAALERDTILERTGLGKDRALRAGKWHGGSTPFGYRIGIDGSLEIAEDEAETVRLIYSLLAEENLGTVQIADYLNANDIPTVSCARGRRPHGTVLWNAGTISRMLNNPLYRGSFVYRKSNGEEITQNVPALVDEATWWKCQGILKKNSVLAKRNSKNHYLLTGLVVCGVCGRTYAGQTHSKKRIAYYRCTGSMLGTGKGTPKCKGKTIRADLVEEIIWKDVKRYILDPGPVIAELERRIREEAGTTGDKESELLQIEEAMSVRRHERSRVISLCRKGVISEEEAEQELGSVAAEIKALEMRQSLVLNEQAHREDSKRRLVDARSLLEELGDKVGVVDPISKKKIVQTLVDSVRVDTLIDNGRRIPKITITYCFDKPTESYCSTMAVSEA